MTGRDIRSIQKKMKNDCKYIKSVSVCLLARLKNTSELPVHGKTVKASPLYFPLMAAK